MIFQTIFRMPVNLSSIKLKNIVHTRNKSTTTTNQQTNKYNYIYTIYNIVNGNQTKYEEQSQIMCKHLKEIGKMVYK